MTTTHTTRRIAVLALVAVMLAVGAVALVGPALATEHVDTLTGDGTDEVEDFNASDEQFLEYTLDADDTDFGTDGTEEVAINISYDGIDHYANESVEVESADTDVTFNISHASLETLPGDAEDTTTVNVTAWGVDEDGNVSTTADEFEVDITFDETRSVRYYAEDTDNFDDVEVGELEHGILTRTLDAVPFVWDADDFDTYHVDSSIGISGDNTTVHLFMADSDMEDGFSDAADDWTTSEDPVLGQTVVVEGELIPVFRDDANTDIVDEDEDTYAIYDGDSYAIEIGEEYEDEDEIDAEAANQNVIDADALDEGVRDLVTAYAGDLGFRDLTTEFSLWRAAWATAPVIGAGLVAAGGLALYTRRRDTEA